MVNDSLSDSLARLINAGMVKKETLDIPFTKFVYSVIQKLQNLGYIKSTEKKGHGIKKQIKVTLNYEKDGSHTIREISRISKQSCRIYSSARDLNVSKRKAGTIFLSTPQGIYTDRESKRENVGGEVLFKII